MKAKNRKYFFFLLLITLWIGIFFILPDFIDSPINNFKSFLLISAYWGVICSITFLLLWSLSASRKLFSVLFPLFVLLGAVIAYYRFAFKASLTPMLVEATFNTDVKGAYDVISLNLILFSIASLVISIFFIRFRNKIGKLKHSYLHLVFPALLASIIISNNFRIRSNVYQRFPLNIYYSLSEYYQHKQLMQAAKIDYEPSFRDIISTDKNDSTVVVFVIGEAARAKNFSLNGYQRETNPLLSKRKNIFSLPRVHSEYTYTSRSIAHIMTRADSIHEDRAFTEHSFISLFNKSGYRTEWISGQNPSEGYVFFMNECDTIIYSHPEKTVYNFNNWYDEDLLPFVEKSLSRGDKNSLLILHTIGSHWYYNSHYPPEFEVYKPVTNSRVVTQNSQEQIINAYDNTILYTDYFLNKLIDLLEEKSALVIYLADHGELLGEDNKWLHAQEHIAIKNPAAIIWMSDKYITKNPNKREAIEKNKDDFWRTDFLFHSIIAGANLPSSSINNDLNVFQE